MQAQITAKNLREWKDTVKLIDYLYTHRQEISMVIEKSIEVNRFIKEKLNKEMG